MQELNQTKPFKHLEEEVSLNLQRTAQIVNSAVVERLKSFDLTGTQYNVLRILRGAGDDGLMCGQISERLITKDSDITRLLDRLENRGLIERERHLKDRRVIVSRVTEEGLKVLTELDEPVTLCVKEQLAHLSAKQLKQLNGLLVLARNKVK